MWSKQIRDDFEVPAGQTDSDQDSESRAGRDICVRALYRQMQAWDDQQFCDTYEATWEISVDQVHYGWLAPGDRDLCLLNEIDLSQANVLDVGCAMGHNLVAMAKLGALGYGLDISDCMLRKAEALVQTQGFNDRITLERGDMRDFAAYGGINFDLILSVYSMEYLSSVRELRSVIYEIYKRLRPGGIFMLCFSHPSQAHRYPEFMNRSVPLGVGKYRTFNYSFKDAMDALYKSGFTIKRVVEQETRDPSKIAYDKSKSFPYHFQKGRNPCTGRYDDISNGGPHTVIYKAQRQHDALGGLPVQIPIKLGYREIWGYRRKIIRQQRLHYGGMVMEAVFLAPMDNVIGVLDVLSFRISIRDLEHGDVSLYSVAGEPATVSVNGSSMLAVIHRKLSRLMLQPHYKTCWVPTESQEDREKGILIASIGVVEDDVRRLFQTDKVGLLVFVNGEEPSRGELPLDSVRAAVGDEITLSYVALRGKQGGDQLCLL